jgi:NAD(P)-dependent dehydrogenase (short-subunit alcohol dehydrogenase family)
MGFAAYAPTKHAVIGITQNGALFYGPYGIRCNSVAPGGTLTPMMKASLPEKYRGTDAYKDENCELVQCTALRTLAVPEEQASVVSFLLGSDSSHVTGVNIMVDGGFTFTRPNFVS